MLTTLAKPGWSTCFPAVMISHCWFALPSQAAVVIGIRFSRKSPDSGSMFRHCPSDVYVNNGVSIA